MSARIVAVLLCFLSVVTPQSAVARGGEPVTVALSDLDYGVACHVDVHGVAVCEGPKVMVASLTVLQ